MLPAPLDAYRRMKKIRRPKRFCLKPLLWYGNLYTNYGSLPRNGAVIDHR